MPLNVMVHNRVTENFTERIPWRDRQNKKDLKECAACDWGRREDFIFKLERIKLKLAEQELLSIGHIVRNGGGYSLKRNWGGETVVRMVETEKKEWESKWDSESDREEVGAPLPLSCVSWPTVKSRSLPVSTGSPQGAIVPESEGETGTERLADRDLNNLVELLMNLSFWRLSALTFKLHWFCFITSLSMLQLFFCIANTGQVSSTNKWLIGVCWINSV